MFGKVIAALSLLPLFLGVLPAQAKPQAVRIDAVYDAGACGKSKCPSSTPKISKGAVVEGPIQVHVHAEDPLGLRWIRLEARFGNNPEWICIQEWEVRSELSADGWYTWNTAIWPKPGDTSDCKETSPHFHNKPTHNLTTNLRVTASNYVDEQERASSPTHPIELSNPARAPQWVSPPSASQTPSGQVVQLSWKPNPEPDLREYRYIRISPNGSEAEFAVSAKNPEGSGCSRIGDTAIRCTDSGLPASGGRFTYAVIALRPAPNGSVTCAVGGGKCVESPFSQTHEVQVAASSSSGGNSGQPDPTITFVPETEQPTPQADPTTDRNEQPSDDGSTGPISVDGGNRSEQLAASANENEGSGSAAMPIAIGLALAAAAAVTALAIRKRQGQAPPDDTP